MSLPPRDRQLSFTNMEYMAGATLGPTDRYRLFHEQLLPVLEKARPALAEMYCHDNGRVAIEPIVMAGVTLLQFMEKTPDRQAVDMLRYHIGWKYALGVEVDFKGFHPTSLVRFRDRLEEHQNSRLIFDTIVGELRQRGLVRKRSKQRLDSTHVLGLVSKMSRLEVVRETLRLALSEIERAGLSGDLEQWERLQERYCESEVDWKHASAATLTERFKRAGQDTYELLDWLATQEPSLGQGKHCLLLRRVFEEQFEFVAGEVTPRKKEASGVVKNPHDPQAEFASKDLNNNKTWVGYKAQVMETVPETAEPKDKGEPTQEFITGLVTTEAISSDLEGMQKVQEEQQAQGEELPPELHVDAAYVTGRTLAEANKEGRELIGPPRPSPGSQPGFKAQDFEVDLEHRSARCPAGKLSTQCSLIHDEHRGRNMYRFEWGRQCDDCGFKGKCTRSKAGRRVLAVGEHHDLIQQRRREMETEAFRQRLRQRTAIEGTISELTRLGMRRTRYRGLARTRLANYFLGAAVNVRRWMRRRAWELAEGARGARATA